MQLTILALSLKSLFITTPRYYNCEKLRDVIFVMNIIHIIIQILKSMTYTFNLLECIEGDEEQWLLSVGLWLMPIKFEFMVMNCYISILVISK